MENNKLTGKEMLKIASISGIDIEDIKPNQLEIGYNIELEHGTVSSDTNVTNNDIVKTIKIAIAHLRENPDYYTLLKKYVEKEKTENMINENNKRFQELLGIKNKEGKQSLMSENFINDNKTNSKEVEVKNTVEYFPITTPIGSEDSKTLRKVIDMGIDSDLEGFTQSEFGTKNTSLGTRDVFNFNRNELPILFKRLENLYDEGDDNAMDMLESIKEAIKQEEISSDDEINEIQYADGKVELPGIDESFFVNESDIIGGLNEIEEEVDAIEYFVNTFYNGQFAQLRNLAKDLRNNERLLELYNELKELGEEKIIDWLFRWLIEG